MTGLVLGWLLPTAPMPMIWLRATVPRSVMTITWPPMSWVRRTIEVCGPPSGPVTVTSLPIKADAVVSESVAALARVSSVSSSSFSTMVNWAVVAMKSSDLLGFIGSWYLSWATRSFKNASLPIELSGPSSFSSFLPYTPIRSVVAACPVTAVTGMVCSPLPLLRS